jgi:hypothetical protein
MTVAASIEILAGGCPEPGQTLLGARAAGNAQSSGWSGAAAAHSSPSSVPGAASFRASWQSLLASAGIGADDLKEEETGADGISTAAKGMLAETTGGASTSMSPTAGKFSLPSRPEKTQQGGQANGATGLSLAKSRAGVPALPTASAAPRQAVANWTAKSTANAQLAASARDTHSANSGKSIKPEAASGETATALATATAVSVPLAMPVQVAESPVANPAEIPQRFPLTDLSTELPTSFIPGASNLHASHGGGSGAAAVITSAGGNQAADTVAGAEGTHSSPSDHSGVAAIDTSAARNQGTDTVTEAKGTHSSHSDGSVAHAGPTRASGRQAGSATATPTPKEKVSHAATRDSLAAERGGAPNEKTDGIKASTPAGTGTLTAGEATAPSELMRPQVGDTLQTLPESQMQIQSVGQGAVAVATPLSSGGVDRESADSIAAFSESGPSPATPSSGGKPGQESNTKATGQSTERLAHTAAHGNLLHEGQTGLAVQDATNNGPGNGSNNGLGAALARDPAGMRTTATMGDAAGDAASKSGTATSDTFAALDAASSSGTHTWVHAGAQRAEAGFEDPALGWVRVRADASGGGVHASLVPGTTEAAQALGSHMAGLSAYLAEQHTPVESLTLAAPEGRRAELGMDPGANQNMHQGTGQDAGQGASSDQQSSPRTSAPALAAAGREVPAPVGRVETTTQAVIPGGVHISVMA